MFTFSVIVTTYNSVASIDKTLKSILEQDGNGDQFNLEVVVVDDCSTDGTAAVVKNNEVIFRSTTKNSGGPNAGRNIGLSIVTGDFICIADQDDIWKPNRLLSILPYCGMANIITSGYTVIDENDGTSEPRVCAWNSDSKSFAKNETFLSRLKRENGGQTTYLGTIFFSSSLKHMEFEEVFGVVDYDWILKIFKNQESIEVCKSLYNRYVDGSNLSLNGEYRKKDYHYSLFCLEGYFEEFPAESRIGYKRINATRAKYHYLMGEMKSARFFFLRSSLNIKNILYYLTTFVGSEWVKKRFNVFG